MLHRRAYEAIVTFCGFLTVAFSVAIVFAPVNVSDAATNSASDGTAYKASISSSDTVSFDVVPTNTQKVFSGKHAISYSNTCPYGFSVALSSSSEKTGMVATIKGKEESIPTVSKTGVALSDNTWGYSTDGGKTFNPIPSVKSPVTLVNLTSESKGAQINLVFGVKANNTIKSGAYAGDVVYTVSAKPECLTYSLSWNYDNGTANNSTTHVAFGTPFDLTKYAVTKNYYTFKGWSNGKQTFTGTEKSVDINPDNLQSITMAAQWEPTKYTISYNLDGGIVSGNPTSYTVETASFTLKNPTKDGYTFLGWTGSNGTTPSTEVTISKGSNGNKSYTANWEQEASDYTITYDLNGGTLDTPNPEKYSSKDAEITLNAPTKSSRKFVEWVCTNDSMSTKQLGYAYKTTDAIVFDDTTTYSSNYPGGEEELYVGRGDLACKAYYEPSTKKKSFSFTGKSQKYTIPEDGFYTLTAVGGDGHPNEWDTASPGRGGQVTYSGVFLKGGTVIYVYVGEGGYAPGDLTKLSWNGGGKSRATISTSDDHVSSGGGATHMATSDGLLSSLTSSSKKKSILIVAGGGSGGATGTAHDTEGYKGGNGCAGPFSSTFGKSPCDPCYNMGSGGGYYGGQMYYGGGACYVKGMYTPKANGSEKLPVSQEAVVIAKPIGGGAAERYKDSSIDRKGYRLAARSGGLGNGSASIQFNEYAIVYPEVTPEE